MRRHDLRDTTVAGAGEPATAGLHLAGGLRVRDHSAELAAAAGDACGTLDGRITSILAGADGVRVRRRPAAGMMATGGTS